MPHYVKINQAASTNTSLGRLADTLPGGTVLYTPCQTAGRGQRGNSWESEPGKNLAFSILLKQPPVAARDQFAISEAASLAVVEALTAATNNSEVFTVKWPNDIYWHDSKVCGMLIENSLQGTTIATSIVGIGINVNQRAFVSDAPNPTSLALITGTEHDLDAILHHVCERIEQLVAALGDEAARTSLHKHYMAVMYRNDGAQHPYQDASGQCFMAQVHDVAPTGALTLRHADGTSHSYLFKEVKHIIHDNLSL